MKKEYSTPEIDIKEIKAEIQTAGLFTDSYIDTNPEDEDDFLNP